MDSGVLLTIGALGIVFGISLHIYYNAPNQPKPGRYTERHKNGKKKVECTYDQKLQYVGEYKEWYDNGKQHIECTFDDNSNLVGEYKSWYGNGKPKVVKAYNKKGQTDGLYVEYYSNGVKSIECTYKEGFVVGSYRIWYENGKPRVVKAYNEHRQHDGVFTHYYENGNKYIEAVYVCGVRNGPHTLWYESGHVQEECVYKNNEYDGVYVKYYDTENKAKSHQYTYKNGERDGLYEIYHSDGKIGEQGYYIRGDGYMLSSWDSEEKLLDKNTYDSENRLEESVKYEKDYVTVTKYKYGVAVRCSKFYKDKKIQEYDMSGDIFHGRCVRYLDSESGYANDRRTECTYECGKLHGEYLEYDAKGAVCKKIIYFYDKVREVVVYNDESGRDCVLEPGNITVWKACRVDKTNVYVRLLVPDDAKRVTTDEAYKARVSHAKVLEIKDKEDNKYDEAYSFVHGASKGFKYVVGETVYADMFCGDPSVKCGSGLSVHKYIEHCDQWFTPS